MSIKKIIPEQILNSRGEPTLKVTIYDDQGKDADFSVPAGASVSSAEATKKFDETESYEGKSVAGCVDIINNIVAPKFIGYPLENQDDFDGLLIALDGSADKANLGANTILALSGAYFKLSAKLSKKPLWQYIAEYQKTNPKFPRIYANLIGGGKHAPGLEIQEFLMIPKTDQPVDAIAQVHNVYHTLQNIMSSLYGPTARLVGDEGALAPLGANSEVVLETLASLNNKTQDKFDIALDVAANSFFDGQTYQFENQQLHASDLMTIYQDWNNKFDLYSIEDPFAENDLEGLEVLKTMPKEKKPFLIVADDYTATNAERINQYGSSQIFDDVIIKPDQVGSITEMFEAITATNSVGNKIIVSHRSGETNDDFIVDLAYGIGAFGIKIGAPCRGERIAKYNRLLEIQYALEGGQPKVEQKIPTKPLKTPIDKSSTPSKVSPKPPTTQPQIPTPVSQANSVQFSHPNVPEPTITQITNPNQATKPQPVGAANFHQEPQISNQFHGAAPVTTQIPTPINFSGQSTPQTTPPQPQPTPQPPLSSSLTASTTSPPDSSFQSGTQNSEPNIKS